MRENRVIKNAKKQWVSKKKNRFKFDPKQFYTLLVK